MHTLLALALAAGIQYTPASGGGVGGGGCFPYLDGGGICKSFGTDDGTFNVTGGAITLSGNITSNTDSVALIGDNSNACFVSVSGGANKSIIETANGSTDGLSILDTGAEATNPALGPLSWEFGDRGDAGCVFSVLRQSINLADGGGLVFCVTEQGGIVTTNPDLGGNIFGSDQAFGLPVGYLNIFDSRSDANTSHATQMTFVGEDIPDAVLPSISETASFGTPDGGYALVNIIRTPDPGGPSFGLVAANTGQTCGVGVYLANSGTLGACMNNDGTVSGHPATAPIDFTTLGQVSCPNGSFLTALYPDAGGGLTCSAVGGGGPLGAGANQVAIGTGADGGLWSTPNLVFDAGVLTVTSAIAVAPVSPGSNPYTEIQSYPGFASGDDIVIFPTNTASGVYQGIVVSPHGAGDTNDNIMSQIDVFNTDFNADQVNYSFGGIRARGSDTVIGTGRSGTGTTNPLIIASGGLQNANLSQLIAFPDGRVGVNTSSSNGADALQVNGTVTASDATTAHQLVALHQLAGAGLGAFVPNQIAQFEPDGGLYSNVSPHDYIYGQTTPVLTNGTFTLQQITAQAAFTARQISWSVDGVGTGTGTITLQLLDNTSSTVVCSTTITCGTTGMGGTTCSGTGANADNLFLQAIIPVGCTAAPSAGFNVKINFPT